MVWLNFFKLPFDEIPISWRDAFELMRSWYYKSEWFQVYDFIEFIGQNAKHRAPEFKKYCNSILEKEALAYRFVGDEIAQIANDSEISAIEKALSGAYRGVRVHLQSALEKLSDRESPDYRNSIKESISAVESLAQEITGNPKATLGQALKLIESQMPLHSALRAAFDKLYGYTSDEKGIRHALLDESKMDFHDAKFMLVACSAFVNYVIGKTENKSQQ